MLEQQKVFVRDRISNQVHWIASKLHSPQSNKIALDTEMFPFLFNGLQIFYP